MQPSSFFWLSLLNNTSIACSRIHVTRRVLSEGVGRLLRKRRRDLPVHMEKKVEITTRELVLLIKRNALRITSCALLMPASLWDRTKGRLNSAAVSNRIRISNKQPRISEYIPSRENPLPRSRTEAPLAMLSLFSQLVPNELFLILVGSALRSLRVSRACHEVTTWGSISPVVSSTTVIFDCTLSVDRSRSGSLGWKLRPHDL